MNLKALLQKVTDDEPLARYIFSNQHFSKNHKRIKRQAFMPPSGKDKVSVMRCKDFPNTPLIKYGQLLADQRESSLKAIASILTKEVRSIPPLNVEADQSKGQHPRHAHIINMDYSKAKHRDLAQDLASKAKVLWPHSEKHKI